MVLNRFVACFVLATCVASPALADEPQPHAAGTGTSHGTVQDLSPTVHDAMFLLGEENGFQRMQIMLTSFVGGCPDWSPAPPLVDDFEHGMIIGLQLAARNAIAEGTYPIGNALPPVATAGVQAVHGTGAQATGGTVQITYRDDSIAEGFYTLTFNGAPLTGVFSAGYCPSLGGT